MGGSRGVNCRRRASRLLIYARRAQRGGQTNDKQRFGFSADGQRIRANQGHSVAVDLGLTPEPPPSILYHGTVERFVTSIMETGLEKRARQHVHLSPDVDTANRVGSRRGKPVILEIAAADMHSAGFLFFRSANGVWLTSKSRHSTFRDRPAYKRKNSAQRFDRGLESRWFFNVCGRRRECSNVF